MLSYKPKDLRKRGRPSASRGPQGWPQGSTTTKIAIFNIKNRDRFSGGVGPWGSPSIAWLIFFDGVAAWGPRQWRGIPRGPLPPKNYRKFSYSTIIKNHDFYIKNPLGPTLGSPGGRRLTRVVYWSPEMSSQHQFHPD